MAIQGKTYTVDEFEQFIALPENREGLFELVNGEIYEKMLTEEHGIIAVKIAARLLFFVEPRPLGRVGVEVEHRPPSDRRNVRLPDVSFRKTPSTPVVTRGSVLQMPDMAVEIKSANDENQNLEEKALYYLQHGARLVWVVYPDRQEVDAYAADQPMKTVDINGSLDRGDALPGFSLSVCDILTL